MDIVLRFVELVPVTLVQSLIYAFVAFGVMLPFRLLGFPDLTSEGSFPIGGCICGAMIAAGFSPGLAMLCGTLGGFLAGSATAMVSLKFRISSLLAGIIIVTMVYSVNLRIMGRSNIALFQFDNLFDLVWPGMNSSLWHKGAFLGIGVILLVVAAFAFLRTEKGIAFRAVGANLDMAEAQGIHSWGHIVGGFGVAGALCAFAGALVVQSQGFSDVNIGFGVLINGLAAVIIGELITGRGSVLRQLLAPIVGAIVYFQIISVCLAMGLAPTDLKFATGALVLLMLAAPSLLPGRRRGALTRDRMHETT
ncbi:ABC transporter permease [Ferrovibrio sp.]|uniref:ABC transporter permease n=1 Tax=Ferrovibrio sp. TaxID=1917215 RepID=UPI00311FC842